MIEFDPYSPEALDDPLPLYKRLRDEDPCHFIEKRNCWALTRFQDVWDGFRDNDHFTSRYGDLSSLVMQEEREPAVIMISNMDHIEHRRFMKALAGSLGLKAIEKIAPRMEAIGRRLIDEAAERERFDMVHDVAWPFISHFTAILCGLPEDEAAAVHRIAHRGIDGIVDEDQVVGVYDESNAILMDYIKKSRKDGFEGDGMIAVFGRLEQAGELHEMGDQVISNHVLNFYLGAPAQFPKGFSSLVHRLFENPDQRAEVINDPNLARPAFLEALRIDTATQSMARVVTKPVEFQGKTMEPGQGVLFMIASAERDEREYPDPDTFDIHRNPPRTVTFGTGEHTCAGRNFGPFLGEMLTRILLERMPNYTVDDSNLEKFKTMFMKGWVNLPTMPS